MEFFLAQIYFVLPIVLFFADIFALAAAAYKRSHNIALMLAATCLCAALCAFASPLASTIFLRAFAPVYFAVICLLTRLAPPVGWSAFALASLLFYALGYLAIHSAAASAALEQFNPLPVLAASWLCALIFGRKAGAGLFALSFWQYLLPIYMSFSSFAGAAYLIIIIKNSRKHHG